MEGKEEHHAWLSLFNRSPWCLVRGWWFFMGRGAAQSVLTRSPLTRLLLLVPSRNTACTDTTHTHAQEAWQNFRDRMRLRKKQREQVQRMRGGNKCLCMHASLEFFYLHRYFFLSPLIIPFPLSGTYESLQVAIFSPLSLTFPSPSPFFLPPLFAPCNIQTDVVDRLFGIL